MAVLRNHTLESLFGGSLDESGITRASIERLVAERVAESDLIDFKRKLWAKSGPEASPWSAEQEFAKDVAAFANLHGGVIVVGVRDQDKVACECTPFVLTATAEKEERRLRQALVNNMSPLAECEFVWADAGEGGLYLAIVVPRSRRSPHAVFADPALGLRFPRRHGDDTIWLNEAEVAEQYKARFSAHSDRRSQLDGLRAAVEETLPSKKGLWISLITAPEVPTEDRLDRRRVESVEQWKASNFIKSLLDRHLPAFSSPLPGPGMVAFSGSAMTGDSGELTIRDA